MYRDLTLFRFMPEVCLVLYLIEIPAGVIEKELRAAVRLAAAGASSHTKGNGECIWLIKKRTKRA